MWVGKRLWSIVFSLAALGVLAGCEEDLSDLNREWMETEEQLAQDLAESEARHRELEQRFESMRQVEMKDPQLIALRNEVDETLKGHERALEEIGETLQDSRERREEVLREGRRGEFEAAWSRAKTDFAAARARRDELSSQHDEILDELEELEIALGSETDKEPKRDPGPSR